MKSDSFGHIYISLSIIFILSFNLIVNSQNTTELYNILSKLPKDSILKIKTYDGSGQVVHPDIIYYTDSIGKSAFYLSLTPYPNFNDSLENPCIYVSSDGLSFAEPDGISNPLVTTPIPYKKNNHHNDDPDLSYSVRDKTFRIIYIQTMQPDSQIVKCIESNELLKWKKSELIKYDLDHDDKFILSPSLVEQKNKFFIFYVNKKKKDKNTIEYIRSRNIHKWHKNNSKRIKIKLPDDITPWHLDIIKGNNKYYMLLNAYVGREPQWDNKNNDTYVLFLAESNNLKHWRVDGKIISCKDIPDIDCRYVYRSTGLIDKNILTVWYSYTNWKPQWRLGLKTIDLNKLTGINSFSH